jgi:C-terminal processing protease CtpA/Prc
LFLVKALPITPYKLGLNYRNLSNEERAEAERNTGLFVGTVYEDTPSFYANVLRGDIIISINGIQFKNMKHFNQLFDEITEKPVTLTILRKGVQKDITVHF